MKFLPIKHFSQRKSYQFLWNQSVIVAWPISTCVWFKGIVQLKMSILSKFHVSYNPYDYLSSAEHKIKHFQECWGQHNIGPHWLSLHEKKNYFKISKKSYRFESTRGWVKTEFSCCFCFVLVLQKIEVACNKSKVIYQFVSSIRFIVSCILAHSCFSIVFLVNVLDGRLWTVCWHLSQPLSYNTVF